MRPIKATVCLLSVMALALGAAADAAAVEGQSLYLEHCASCHAPDGKGRTPAGKKFGAKDLTESKLSDADIARQIVDGTKDAKGKARMPAFKEKLTPADVSSLAAYLKALRKQPLAGP
jgi:mono/diheme cytochrome c family protein